MKGKFVKFLSMVIIVATLVSLSGCDFLDPNNGDSSLGSIPVEPSHLICYSITTDKAEYGYGDEIEITAAIQFNGGYKGTSHHNEVGFSAKFTVSLEKSSRFEILGNESYVFDSLNTGDYICCKEDSEKIIVKFKVKFDEVNEENYVTDLFEIKTERGSVYEWSSAIPTKNSLTCYYILDSQGVIVQQIPSSHKHLENGHHDDRSGSFYNAYSHKGELIAASYNREYESGVSVEELIDRYYNMQNYVYYYGRKSSEECYLTYISSGVRFKIYLPKDSEYIKLYEGIPFNNGSNSIDEAEKEYLEKFLSFALENGAIAEKEYNAEILRISGSEENVENGNSSPKIRRFYGEPTELWKMQDELVFTVPAGDNFYNCVISVEK